MPEFRWNLIAIGLMLFINSEAQSECPTWEPQVGKQEIAKLQHQITQWNEAYFVDGRSMVADEVYDQMLEQLSRWKACFSTVDTEPAIPAPPRPVENTLPHPVKHTGLKKLQDEADVARWFNAQKEVWIQPKIDGVAVTLHYQHGRFIHMISRGDGVIGQNWTHHARAIRAIPLQIDDLSAERVFQGELFLKVADHQQIHQGGINARATVAGAMKRAHLPSSLSDNLDLFIWAFPDGPENMRERLALLTRFGFPLAERYSYQVSNVKEIEQWRQKWYRGHLPFVTDGVVLHKTHKPAGIQWQASPPNWAVAWKYPNRQQVALVQGVDFSVGRTGKVSVMLQLEPVQIDDKQVSRVSLGTIKRWQQWDVLPGDRVVVALAGLGTPRLEQVIWRNLSRVAVSAPSQEHYHFLSCWRYRPDCEQQFVARLVWMTQQLQIDPAGTRLWIHLVKQGRVSQLSDLMGLSQEDWMQSGKANQETAKRLVADLKRVRESDAQSWLHALGVPDEWIPCFQERLGKEYGRGSTPFCQTSLSGVKQKNAQALWQNDEWQSLIQQLRQQDIAAFRQR